MVMYVRMLDSLCRKMSSTMQKWEDSPKIYMFILHIQIEHFQKGSNASVYNYGISRDTAI